MIAYLRSRRWVIIGYLALWCVIASVFSLERLPLIGIHYPLALCTAGFITALAVDASKFLAKRKRLSAYLRDVDLLGKTPLPEAYDAIERDYNALLDEQTQRLDHMCQENARRMRETEDYYTAWVHQVKTPIAAMRLTLADEDNAAARLLGEELTRIDQYVEMALIFQRLDSDVADYVFRECRLDDIIRPAVRRFRTTFIRKRLRLEYVPIQSSVVTDEKWLAFVVEQLLSNALKYTQEGGVSIQWTQARTLCIRDTGIGIAASDLPRVFDRGYTGENGRVDQSASGIGLYLCRRICANLNIELRLESEQGSGTCAILRFPEPKSRHE